MNNEAVKKGIIGTDQDAKDYISKQISQMENLKDNDPGKIAFLNDIRANGFSIPKDYENNPNVLDAIKKMLMQEKLRNEISKDATNYEDKMKIWNNYQEELIQKGDYQIYIPIDIKGS